MKTDGNDLVNSGEDYEYIGQCVTRTIKHSGLTKRELFAAMAMQGLLSDWPTNYESAAENAAKTAVKFADALINELNEETGS